MSENISEKENYFSYHKLSKNVILDGTKIIQTKNYAENSFIFGIVGRTGYTSIKGRTFR